MSKKKAMTGRDFDALPDAEKERIFRELDNLTAAQLKEQFRPMSRKEKQALYQRPKGKSGRPKFGKAGHPDHQHQCGEIPLARGRCLRQDQRREAVGVVRQQRAVVDRRKEGTE